MRVWRKYIACLSVDCEREDNESTSKENMMSFIHVCCKHVISWTMKSEVQCYQQRGPYSYALSKDG